MGHYTHQWPNPPMSLELNMRLGGGGLVRRSGTGRVTEELSPSSCFLSSLLSGYCNRNSFPLQKTSIMPGPPLGASRLYMD